MGDWARDYGMYKKFKKKKQKKDGQTWSDVTRFGHLWSDVAKDSI